MDKGEPVAAIQHLQRVRPRTVETQFNLVRAYLQSGKPAEALRTARQMSLEQKKRRSVALYARSVAGVAKAV